MDVLVLTYALLLLNPVYSLWPPQIEPESIHNFGFEAAFGELEDRN